MLPLRLKDLQCIARVAVSHRWCPHDPTEKQRAFLALDALEALYGGAAGGGKSDALLMAALQYVDTPGYSAILFRRTYTDLSLPGAIMQRAGEWLGDSTARWLERDKTFVFPSGARLAFGYLDGARDHYRYQSAEFQFVAFDELTQFEDRQYRYLFSRLRRCTGVAIPLRMRGATNPGGVGHDWVQRRFIDAPEPGRVFIPARLEDNPHTDRVEYERALAQLDPVTQRQLRDGEWVRDTTGLVYYSWSDRRNMAETLPALPEGELWSRVLGADFGVTDPTAFVELAFNEHEPAVYVTRSAEWRALSPSEAAEKALAWERSIGSYDAFVGDVGGLGKGFQAEWQRRFAIPLRAAQKGDKLGYQKLLNGDLHHARLVVLEGNDKLVRDLKVLAFKDDTCRLEHPSLPNHLPDALLYGWREARHWQWEERPPRVADTELERRRDAMQRHKAQIVERNHRKQDENDDSWIFGPD